ncbi:pentapeptide repeat protein [Alteromonadaceae bacterium 2753L.S.0a.02]|nr:pentapeptide repeat protein [Alteromonadaceae bacterium 2753L.S.0a.02]
MKDKTKLIWVLCFSAMVAISHLLGNMALLVAAWVLKLPNITYLYVFAWLPLCIYVLYYTYGEKASSLVRLVVCGVFYAAFVAYLVVGVAQLYRAFIIPFGLITLYMAYFFYKSARELDAQEKNSGYKCFLYKTVGTVLLIALSNIYAQPWKLVVQLPNVKNVDLRDQSLAGMEFNSMRFENVNLKGVDFSGTSFSNVKFENVDLSYSIFNRSKLESVKLTNSNLYSAVISKSRLYEAEIINTNMVDALIYKSFVGRVDIKESLICGTKFVELPYSDGVYSWKKSKYNKDTVFPTVLDPERKLLIESNLDCKS